MVYLGILFQALISVGAILYWAHERKRADWWKREAYASTDKSRKFLKSASFSNQNALAWMAAWRAMRDENNLLEKRVNQLQDEVERQHELRDTAVDDRDVLVEEMDLRLVRAEQAEGRCRVLDARARTDAEFVRRYADHKLQAEEALRKLGRTVNELQIRVTGARAVLQKYGRLRAGSVAAKALDILSR